jgi:hypothetical protein
VYFEAKNPIGKPADVEGRIVDDHGNAVGTFTSYHDGLGRFELTPNTGRTYTPRSRNPSASRRTSRCPWPQEDGCNLRSFDDFDGQDAALRVAVRCADRPARWWWWACCARTCWTPPPWT